MVGLMVKGFDGWTDRCTGGQTDILTDEQIDGLMVEQTEQEKNQICENIAVEYYLMLQVRTVEEVVEYWQLSRLSLCRHQDDCHGE